MILRLGWSSFEKKVVKNMVSYEVCDAVIIGIGDASDCRSV